jgi:cytochrome P450
MMVRAVQDMDSELPYSMTWHAATTIYNGFPTVLSGVIKMLEYLLMRLWLVQACREHPELIPGVVRGALKDAVHFTFGLPGVCMNDALLDGYVIRAGTTVLPSFHGAEGPAGLKAWGSPGAHACLGMHIARIILESAVRAIAAVLKWAAVPWSEVTWREGTMPLPMALPWYS